MNLLFERYPRLHDGIAYIPLGQFPTPVQRMEHLEEALIGTQGAGQLYVKRDDLSGDLYGGNKVRKLEFLLGDALRRGRRTVMTFGGAGSNHALATALYAKRLGLHTMSMLVPQPNAGSVRRNLLKSLQAGVELHHYPDMPRTVAGSLYQIARHTLRDGKLPYIIPPGGTAPLGMVGFVSAALELDQQIQAGLLPEPDYLYAASGTMGTVIGLLLGLVAAGLRTRVMAVRVTDPRFTSMRKARRLFTATNALLHRADPAFPLLAFPEDRFNLRHDYYGQAYGLYTPESVRAVHRFHETEGLKLEGTYTGKTTAAMLADNAAGLLRGKTVLFWNTYNSTDFSADLAGIDYHRLPQPFHRYFEEDVQPLDR